MSWLVLPKACVWRGGFFALRVVNEAEESRCAAVRGYLTDLQEGLLARLREVDTKAAFRRDAWDRPGGGGGVSAVLADGGVVEKGGVNFSDVRGTQLPPAATNRRPQLAGRPFRAMGVSVVIHPCNPYVPTAHMNVRYFEAGGEGAEPVFWFGGGFDLTPYYPSWGDAVAWHREAKAACDPHGGGLYDRFKAECDRYFFLPHRCETRGVGGLFFDDFNELGFDASFAFTRSVGDAFARIYPGLVKRRTDDPFTAHHRRFQLYRRGRYAEFNLLHDRGTLFGLQSGGRTESILMSLPPLARWDYDWSPEPGSHEAALYEHFLRPRDWLGEERPADLTEAAW